MRGDGIAQCERRSHQRMGFIGAVRWNTGGVDRTGWARDVSEFDAGFACRALSAPKTGDKIRVVFELPPDHEWVLDDAAVVTRCDRTDVDVYHVGVQLNPLGIE